MVKMSNGLYLRLEQGKLLRSYLNLLQKDQKLSIEQLHISFEGQKRKIEEHDFTLAKIQKRTASFEDFQKKLHELDTERKILESKLNQEISNIKNHTELLREKIRVSVQDIEQFDKQTTIIQEEVRRYQENLIDYKEKINKTVTQIHSDMATSVNAMKIKVEAASGLESHFTTQVKHLTEELKKIDLNYEQEKMHNMKTITRFVKKVNKIKLKSEESSNLVKEFDALLKTQDRKISINNNITNTVQDYIDKTDKYLALFMPIQILNQVAEAMHSALEGRPFNRLIMYEQNKYQQLEELINNNDMTQFNKEEYKIPILPDFVDEKMQNNQNQRGDPGNRDFNSKEESHLKDETLSDHLSDNDGFKVKYPKSYINDHEERLVIERNNRALRNFHSRGKSKLKPDTFTEISGPYKKADDTISDGENTHKMHKSLYNQRLRFDSQLAKQTSAKVGDYLNQHFSEAQQTRVKIAKKFTQKVQIKAANERESQYSHIESSEKNKSQINNAHEELKPSVKIPQLSSNLSGQSGIQIIDQNSQISNAQQNNNLSLNQLQSNQQSRKTLKIREIDPNKLSSSNLGAESNQTQNQQQQQEQTRNPSFSALGKEVRRATLQVNDNTAGSVEVNSNENILSSYKNKHNESHLKSNIDQEIQEEQSSETSKSEKSKSSIKNSEILKNQQRHDSQSILESPEQTNNNLELQNQDNGKSSIFENTSHFNSLRAQFSQGIHYHKNSLLGSNEQVVLRERDINQLLNNQDFIVKLKEMFQPMIDESLQEIAEQIDQNMDFLEQKFNVFNKAIEMQATSFEEQLDIKEKEIYSELDDLKVQVDTEIKKRQRAHNDFMIENKKALTQVTDNKSNIETLENQIRIQTEIMGCLIESLIIESQLDIQDELDKESMALYAKNNEDSSKSLNNYHSKVDASTSPDLTQRISLDQNCLSCTNQPSLIYKAYKLACLRYQPSDIKYKNVTLTRKAIIKLNRQLLTNAQIKLLNEDSTLSEYYTKSIEQIMMQNSQQNAIQRLQKNQKQTRNMAQTTNQINKDPYSKMGIKFNIKNNQSQNSIIMSKSVTEDVYNLNQAATTISHNISHLDAMTHGILNDTDISLINSHKKASVLIPLSNSRNFQRDPYDQQQIRFQTAVGQKRGDHNNSLINVGGYSQMGQSFYSSSRIIEEKEGKNNRASTSMGMKTEYTGFYSMNDQFSKRRKLILDSRNQNTGRQILQNQKIHNMIMQKTPEKKSNHQIHNQSMDQIIVEGKNRLNELQNHQIRPFIQRDIKHLRSKKSGDNMFQN